MEGWVTDSGSLLPGVSAQGVDSGHATKVVTSKQSASTLLFCKTGQTTIRQKETETVTEYRGLDSVSAQAKVAASTDGTTQTGYYATFSGEDHSITVTTGTKKEVSARRANDANGWTVTVREVAYSVVPDITANGYTGPWKTSRVVAGGGTARTVSVNVSSTHVRTYSDVALYSTKKVTVTEHPGLSQAAAETLATTLANQTSVAEKVMVCTVQSYVNGGWLTGSWCYASLHVGTIVYTTTRKVSDEEGYVVTETKEEYDWRQAGAVNTASIKKSWSVQS